MRPHFKAAHHISNISFCHSQMLSFSLDIRWCWQSEPVTSSPEGLQAWRVLWKIHSGGKRSYIKHFFPYFKGINWKYKVVNIWKDLPCRYILQTIIYQNENLESKKTQLLVSHFWLSIILQTSLAKQMRLKMKQLCCTSMHWIHKSFTDYYTIVMNSVQHWISNSLILYLTTIKKCVDWINPIVQWKY